MIFGRQSYDRIICGYLLNLHFLPFELDVIGPHPFVDEDRILRPCPGHVSVRETLGRNDDYVVLLGND